ncbi:MAG: hypothetical protein IKL31_09940, partial [Ruminococcus sp.]|nr:hypothetical protein [Ruminococcus sp.]
TWKNSRKLKNAATIWQFAIKNKGIVFSPDTQIHFYTVITLRATCCLKHKNILFKSVWTILKLSKLYSFFK